MGGQDDGTADLGKANPWASHIRRVVLLAATARGWNQLMPVSTDVMAAAGMAETFGRGRNLAAWLGVVPKQATTGGKPKLLGISKRGSRYLRKMLREKALADGAGHTLTMPQGDMNPAGKP